FTAALEELRANASGAIVVVSHATVMVLYLARELGIKVRPADWAAIGMPDVCVVDPDARRILREWGQTRF
ncbi:MAG: hypothetical protein GEU28_08885, partial [Dehalococcoidia bacterium]|nr:hypothetical protein [Dehalococcoidia bacterium]